MVKFRLVGINKFDINPTRLSVSQAERLKNINPSLSISNFPSRVSDKFCHLKIQIKNRHRAGKIGEIFTSSN